MLHSGFGIHKENLIKCHIGNINVTLVQSGLKATSLSGIIFCKFTSVQLVMSV